MTDEHDRKLYVRFVIFMGVIIVLFFWAHNMEFLSFNSGDKILILQFEDFAIAVNAVYEALPNVAKQFFSVGAIGTKLLMAGYSPIIFGLILASAQTVGQMGLYLAGMVIKKSHSGSFGKIADRNHFLHKHHFLIYFAIPFSGVLGDGLMLYSGHQRINPLKIIPFIFLANLADNYKWVFSTVTQLEISDGFT